MVIETLKDTLTKVNDWLKFAETKNAANIAFCSASIFAVLRITLNMQSLGCYAKWYILFIITCLVISLTISLLSFVPKLKAPWLHIDNRNKDDNLLYYGHACKYSGSKYLEILYDKKSHESKNYEIELAYSNQIVTNSKIAYIKYEHFNSAIWFTLTALISPVGAFIVSRMRNNF